MNRSAATILRVALISQVHLVLKNFGRCDPLDFSSAPTRRWIPNSSQSIWCLCLQVVLSAVLKLFADSHCSHS